MLYQSGKCSTPKQLLIPSSFGKKHGHALLMNAHDNTHESSVEVFFADFHESSTDFHATL